MSRIKTQTFQSFSKIAFDTPIDEKATAILKKATATCWVASGLSACAAECARYAYSRCHSKPAIRMTPLQYCQEPNSKITPILISYKGRNSDIYSAAEKLSQTQVDGVVVSGLPVTSISKKLKEKSPGAIVVPLNSHDVDRAFVSTKATISLALLSCKLVFDSAADNEISIDIDKIIELARSKATKISLEIGNIPNWQTRHWFVLSGPNSYASMLAWERGLAEAGLTVAAGADIKDFTHGRYFASINHNNAGLILIVDPDNVRLCDIAEKNLSTAFPVVRIDASGTWSDVLLQNIILAFIAIEDLAEMVGSNTKKPIKPKITSRWNNWGRIKF